MVCLKTFPTIVWNRNNGLDKRTQGIAHTQSHGTRAHKYTHTRYRIILFDWIGFLNTERVRTHKKKEEWMSETLIKRTFFTNFPFSNVVLLFWFGGIPFFYSNLLFQFSQYLQVKPLNKIQRLYFGISIYSSNWIELSFLFVYFLHGLPVFDTERAMWIVFAKFCRRFKTAYT